MGPGSLPHETRKNIIIKLINKVPKGAFAGAGQPDFSNLIPEAG
jgi:hypothetical protein